MFSTIFIAYLYTIILFQHKTTCIMQRLLRPKLLLSCITIAATTTLLLAFKEGPRGPKSAPAPVAQPVLDTEENRFTKVVLAEKLDEPLDMQIFKNGKIIFVERKGNIKLYDPATKKTSIIANIPVSTKYTDKQGKKSEAEDGLFGITLDPGYYKNHWIYLYYAPAGDVQENILTRYEFVNDKLNLASKKILLHVATQREQCCHTGGRMDWDAQGNLYLTTGDNTSSRGTVYSPSDERPERSPWDAQKSSANTNDLRGKILRIHPEPDGTYTIPDGNLFPKGMAKTRPEIYVMGLRNPYTLYVDKHNGYVMWGEVGPDAGKDSATRGPKSYDEYNIAKKPGFFGWPYFNGDNRAFNKYNFATGVSGEKWDAAKPINNSPNNTGLNELPPTQPAFIWYAYDASKEFPLLGTGGRSAMGGPVFHPEDLKEAKTLYPQYYNDKWFIFEWMRDWIMTVSMDKDGNYKGMERFMPHTKFSHPMAMRFGPDGCLYILEYGQGWFMQNDDSKLVRIDFSAGPRKPLAVVTADKTEGSLPLAVNLSSNGSKDFDNGDLTYQWKVTSSAGFNKTFTDANPSITFDKGGAYKATLTVTNSKGLKGTSTVQINAGNEPPVVSIDITGGNKSFYTPNTPFSYKVNISDKEDGEVGKGITPANVNVSINYVSDESLIGAPPMGHQAAGEAVSSFSAGKNIIAQLDCKSCHAPNKKIIGPSYMSISQKYKADAKAYTKLPTKIINGGSGVWGDVAMAAHPNLSKSDAQEIVKYILSLAKPKPASLPLSGTYTPKVPADAKEGGVIVITASYTDKGNKGAPALRTEQQLILRTSKVAVGAAKASSGITKFKMPDGPEMLIIMGNKSNLSLQNIDLTNIDSIGFDVLAPKEQLNALGGKIEIHLDSPTGTLIGTTPEIMQDNSSITQMKPVPIAAAITPTTGTHNVYFVFTKDGYKMGALFIVFDAVFKSH